MDPMQKEQLLERLERRYGAMPSAGMTPSGRADRGDQEVREAMQRMVDAGAARFGVRADQRARSGFSACELAPPLARMIDHTALKPDTTADQIDVLCDEARRYCFASVCVNPTWVPMAAGRLDGSEIPVCTVVGFPFGASRAPVKAREAEVAIADGAAELDMVINVGFLKSGRYEEVERDIASVVSVARRAAKSTTVKVILETALLTDEEKVIGCILAKNAGADFVKTSTGFSSGGATAADVALMRKAVGDKIGVKASGGIRSREDAETMIAQGATRIGASASVAIIRGMTASPGY